MPGLVDAGGGKGIAQAGVGGAHRLHPHPDTGPPSRQQSGAGKRTHRNGQLTGGHLRQAAEDLVGDLGPQAVEGRHVALQRRHPAAFVLFQVDEHVIVHLSAVNGIPDGVHHNAVDGIGDPGGGQAHDDGPHVQHCRAAQPGHQQDRQPQPDPPPLPPRQPQVAYSSHGIHPLWVIVCRQGGRGYSAQELTMALKVLPRSMKFLNWSKAAQAGERVTTSPGTARSRAVSTAR